MRRCADDAGRILDEERRIEIDVPAIATKSIRTDLTTLQYGGLGIDDDVATVALTCSYGRCDRAGGAVTDDPRLP